MKSIIAASLFLSSPPTPDAVLPDFGAKPTIDLSAIRMVSCEGGHYGSGFLIGDNVLATALHVANLKNCQDDRTQTKLVKYYEDKEHDFALMRSELKGIPYIKYDCSRYVTGKHYASYGYSGYLQNYIIFRQSDMYAYKDYSGPDYVVSGRHYPNMRHLFGPMVFGHSGGPIIDTETGNVIGINNSGDTFLGLITGHSYSTELADTVLCKGDKK